MSRKEVSVPPHGRKGQRRLRTRAKRYFVVCGGEVTEPQYFKHLKSEISGTNNCVIDVKPIVGSPSQLAKYAAASKRDDERNNGDSADRYAGIFVVVDVDNFHDHLQAQQTCIDNGISLIISNPCFEVWLIDHLQPCPEAYATTPDVERYAARKGITGGPRNKHINWKNIAGLTQDAVINAKKHNSASKAAARKQLTPYSESNYAPWTDMPEVIEVMK
ncbi:RloB family protein [Bifidobacterium sp. SO4]|uniref:RloB family protein n=1 Tax=Bifidobacterium sp. SO4 TaxID=2809030 RepID=UPI001BDDC54A|nr:RloB family protein [Bifidobacterium sp. SO4]MBT1169964.1 RloB domain-containing protein [Bifidobacterium sp. SO4]